MHLSIITINYNNKKGLEKTINSVVRQTFREFEYIVIDGNSNDGSIDVIHQHNSNINHWVSESDKGIYDAMNKGISLAKGEYIMFINSGDELYSENVLGQLIEINGEQDIIYSDIEVIDLKKSYVKKYPQIVGFRYMIEDALAHPGCLIKRNLFTNIGMYDTNLKIVSDWKWFLIAIFKYNATSLHTGITVAKFYLDGISSNHENRLLIYNERQQTTEKYFPNLMSDCQELIELRLKVSKIKKSSLVKFFQKLGLFKYLN